LTQPRHAAILPSEEERPPVAEPKTKPTKRSVAAFLETVPDVRKREDAAKLIALMREAAKCEPVMWGPSIIGFGSFRYKYQSGREGDWPIIGLSPRKQNLTIYIMPGFVEYRDLIAKLGPHTTGVSCLYIKRLADIDLPTLKKIIKGSIAQVKQKVATG
jgi:hypothetical protein